ncbi:tape measure protein [Desulfotomaculum copahuensis]|uniref:Tape measure protein N-terminal domain-containing protein n=1 Tax=Desulfotomaculum copahuensis TaxID=1838280 RepID=A0A1B7LAJ1_9FIRM|nr:tape measure protein [Desulfotomaculum copahuensis]OAT79310.1 hypothetical protein A6M21_16240 [Desulfotomaculum copahuensis]
MEIGSMFVKLNLDMSGFKKSLDDATSRIRGIGEKMSSSFKAALPSSQMLAAGLTGVAAGIAAFGTKSVIAAGQMEQTQVAFKTMLGSAEKASALMKDLQKFGAETPFEFPEIQKSAKSLLAFGIEAGKMKDTLRAIGDVASGVGAPLDEIAEIYGKARVQGRLFAEDIDQLTGRGIPIIGELAKQFGVSEGEVKKLVESGKVGFPQLERAFKSMTGEGGRFHDMMKAQSETLPGMWSNLMDSIGMSSVVVGQEIIKAFDLKDKLAGAIDALNRISSLLQDKGLKGALAELFPPDLQLKITMIAGAIAGALVPAFIAAGTAIWGAMTPLLPFMAAGAAVAALAFTIYKSWEPIKGFFVNTWESIKNVTVEAWDAIKTKLSSTWEGIKALASNVWTGIKDFFKKWGEDILLLAVGPAGWSVLLGQRLGVNWNTIKQTTLTVWNGIQSGISNIWGSITSAASSATANLYSTVRGRLESIWSYIQSIPSQAYSWGKQIIQAIASGIRSIHIPMPHFNFSVDHKSIAGISVPVPDVDVNWYARGGIFNKPSIIGVGEAGPEAVVPLNKANSIGGLTINIQNMQVRNDQDIPRIARELWQLQQAHSRGVLGR